VENKTLKVLWCLLGSVVLSVATIRSQREVNGIQNQIQNAIQYYSKAIENTKNGISFATKQLASDQVLSQNVAWGLTNSVSKFLEGQLRPGAVDALTIFDEGCNLIVHASNYPSPSKAVCAQKAELSPNQPLFTWSAGESGPELSTLVKVTAEGKNYLFAASTLLNRRWLDHYPQLASLASKLKIEIGDKSQKGRTILVQEGPIGAGQWVASLSTNSVPARLGAYVAQNPAINLDKLALIFNTLTFILTIAAMISFYLQSRDQTKRETEFLNWLHNVKTSGGGSTPQQTAGVTDQLLMARELITEAFQAHTSSQVQLCKEIDAGRLQCSVLEEELLQAREKIIAARHYQSLADQINATLSSFTDKLRQIQSDTEDVVDALIHGVSRNSQILHRMTDEWQQALSLSSARKFLRSLSENILDDQRSELDHSLDRLFLISDQISSTSVTVSVSSQKLLGELGSIIQIADHWSFLSSKEKAPSAAGKVLDIVVESHGLIQLIPSLPSHRIASLFPPDLSLDGLNIPRSTVISAFYHIFLSLLEAAKVLDLDDLELRISSKNKNDHKILVLSISHGSMEATSTPSKLFRGSHYHYEVALQLLKPFKVQTVSLPTIKGLSAIMLSWKETVQERTHTLQIEAAKKPPLAEDQRTASFAKAHEQIIPIR
jgi:hypothetical protein